MMFRNRLANFLWWRLVLRPLDWIAGFLSRGNPGDKVLVAYPARIGDSVMWLDAARAVKELYPCRHVTLLADPAFAPLAATQPQFDSVWEFDRRRYSTDLRYRFRLNRRIAAAGFGVVLNPAPWPDQYNVDSVLAVSRAPRRVGWMLKSPTDSRAARAMRNWRRRQYTTVFVPPRSPISMLRHHEHFIRELGLTSYKPHAPSLVVDPQLAQSVPASPFFVICPGASESLKRWPIANFARLADAIVSATGMAAAVCGAANEVETALELQSLVHAPVVNLTGKLDLVRLAALFARAALVVANDSGPLHLAAASGAPSLCILGGGTFGWCMPYDVPPAEHRSLPRAVWHEMDCYGCRWRCVFDPGDAESAPCLAEVSVDRVLDEALRILVGSANAQHFGVSTNDPPR